MVQRSTFAPYLQMTTLGEHTLADIDIDGIVSILPTRTEAGRAALRARLADPITDPAVLLKRQTQIRELRARMKDPEVAARVAAARATLSETEPDVASLQTAATDSRHAEYYTQILWAPDSTFARMNTASWFTEAMVFLRTLLLPALSVILPLFVFIAPFFVYHFVLKEPLTFTKYIDLLQASLKKAMPSMLGKPRFKGQGGALEAGEQFAHIGASVVMFVMGCWNQVSAARSMRAVVADMRRRATAVSRCTEAVTEMATMLGVSVPAVSWPMGSLGLFGAAWNDPSQIQTLLTAAGELDALVTVAGLKRTCFVTHTDVSGAFALRDLYHPGIPMKARVYNSITLRDRSHILLTGPNRGGKSTLLKSLGAAVLMSQTLGLVFAREATLPIFGSIVTALAPTDTLGKMSLFEAEIEFAKSVKARLQDTAAGPMFLMMDEIFHGTNAHDGVEASQVFLDDLYKMNAPVISVVSTHYMELPARYGAKEALNMCMEASVDPQDPNRLIYSYRLSEGVNQCSSVREILKERGLLK